MDWSDVGKFIGSAAPLVGTILGGPPGAALGQMISATLGTDNTPDAVMKELKTNPDAVVKIKQMQLDHKESLEKMHLEAETARLTQINTTMRAELASGDKFKSYWRPLFGYMVALTWFLESLAIVYVIITRSAEDAAKVITALSALGMMWSLALAILGVNIRSRTNDKAAMMGQDKEMGILGAIAQRIRGSAPPQ